MKSLAEALDCFLVEQELRGNTQATIEDYRSFVGLFLRYTAEKKILGAADVTLTLVNEYQLYLLRKNKLRDNSKALARVTVRTYLRHLKIFLRYCYQENFLSEDIAVKMRLPKAEKPMIEILSDSEIHKIFAYFENTAEMSLRNKAIVGLMLDCGLRVSEVVGLSLSSVRLADGCMYVTGKGRKGRLVPLGAKIQLFLTAYIASRPASAYDSLFLNNKGKPITFNVVKALCFRIKKKQASGVFIRICSGIRSRRIFYWPGLGISMSCRSCWGIVM